MSSAAILSAKMEKIGLASKTDAFEKSLRTSIPSPDRRLERSFCLKAFRPVSTVHSMIPLLVGKSPLPLVESGESALVKVWCYHLNISN